MHNIHTLTQPPYKNNLDFIRTCLALGVLSYHALGTVGISFIQFPWVPAFIALSGFLITESMAHSKGIGHFIWKRLLRIGPAFLLSLLLVASLGGNASDALFDWIFMGIKTTGANAPLWSLSVEEGLYLSLAIAFLLGIYNTKRRALFYLGIFYFSLLLISTHIPAQAVPIFRVALCFIAGSALNLMKEDIRWVISIAVLCILVAVWMRNGGLVKTSILYQSLIGPMIAYGLITLAFYAPAITSGYRSKVGDPSFGIYIYHWPIMSWLYLKGFQDFWLLPMTLCMTVTIALLSWHFVEKYALNLKDWYPG